MKREYWIEKVVGKLYAVCWNDGNYTHRAYEGTESECESWIRRNG